MRGKAQRVVRATQNSGVTETTFTKF